MKRALLLLVAGLLAGCTLPGDDEAEPQLFGSCPQWVASAQAVEEAIDVDGAGQLNVSAEESHLGHPLDMYFLTMTTDGPLRVQAFLPSGARTTFHEVDDDRLLTPPTLHVDGSKDVRVFLTPVEHGQEAAPGPIRLTFEGAAHLDVTATPFYRVCGVLVD